MPLNDRQHIIEVMCDSGRQLADRLHFLRLPQLRLQVEPVRDVFHIRVHHSAGFDRVKRPGKGAIGKVRFQTELAFTSCETSLNDVANI